MFLALFNVLGRQWFGQDAMRAAMGPVPTGLQAVFDIALVLFVVCLGSHSLSSCWKSI